MSLYKNFKTDESIEQSGVILEYGVTDDNRPIRIRIARAGGGNARFAKLLEQKLKPHRRQIQNESLDESVASSILREVYAETVILGWENVQDKDGKDLPFNKENCLQLLTDLPELFSDIREQSTKVALFRADIRELTAKN